MEEELKKYGIKMIGELICINDIVKEILGSKNIIFNKNKISKEITKIFGEYYTNKEGIMELLKKTKSEKGQKLYNGIVNICVNVEEDIYEEKKRLYEKIEELKKKNKKLKEENKKLREEKKKKEKKEMLYKIEIAKLELEKMKTCTKK